MHGPLGEVTAAEPAEPAAFIGNQRTGYDIPHRVSCRVLGVGESWFYKGCDRQPAGRDLRRQQLTDEVKEIFKDSGGACGSPKIFILLVRKGWRTSVNTVARLMAGLGLVARVVKHRRGLTGQGKRSAAPDFEARLHGRGARSDLGGRHDGDRHCRGEAVSCEGH
jgi:putative transposase